MNRNKIEPRVILTIDTEQYLFIPLIVTDNEDNILHMTHANKLGKSYFVRKEVIKIVEQLVIQYNVDTIVLEQNKLFIDKIDRYPDPYVMRNVQLDFGIKVSIEDRFHDSIKYILEFPKQDWTQRVLNRFVKYSIDLYKAHILERGLSEELTQAIDKYNYYKALCLSESVRYDSLLNTKYQLNKGD